MGSGTVWFSQNRPENSLYILRANHTFCYNSPTVWDRMLKFWIQSHHMILRTVIVKGISFWDWSRVAAHCRAATPRIPFGSNSLTVYDRTLAFCIWTSVCSGVPWLYFNDLSRISPFFVTAFHISLLLFWEILPFDNISSKLHLTHQILTPSDVPVKLSIQSMW